MQTQTKSARLPAVVAAIALATLAFVPRAASLDRALTIDERLWVDRSERFIDNVFAGRFSQAYETGHPGVTIMWIGGLAQRTLPDDATLRERHARARLGMAVADVVVLLLVAGLLASLAGARAGIAAGVLLALDPFLLAHNRVLHLDGLLALLMAASFLSLIRSVRTGSRRWLLASGALAGLAALTKQPSVFLVAATAIALWRNGGGVVKRLAAWSAIAAGVAFLLYPALWTAPGEPVGLLLGSAARGASDSHSGGFFLGEARGNPGPLFYPVVFLWRTSILTLPAAVATAVWAFRHRRDEATKLARALLLFALGFMVMMTLGLKKGDRYVLPSFVAVDVAIALGAAHVFRNTRARTAAAGLAAAAALHGGPAIALHPYQEAHYNWIVGGPRTAQHVLVVGWGEGLDQAARALNRLPGASTSVVATSRLTQFGDYFVGNAVRLEDSTLVRTDGGVDPDYVLFYISSVQTERFAGTWRMFRDRTPLYRLDVNGIPFVRVYQVRG